MKLRFFITLALFVFCMATIYAQTNTTIRATKAEIKKELRLAGRAVKGISRSGTISGSGSNDSLLTQKAVKDYVTVMIASGRVTLRNAKPSPLTTYISELVIDTLGVDSAWVWNFSIYRLLLTSGGGGGTTNLAYVTDANTGTVSNSNGSGFVIPEATDLIAGLLSATKKLQYDSKNAGLQFKDEGSNLGAQGTVTAVDFTGAGAMASRSGNTITVNVPGAAELNEVPVFLFMGESNSGGFALNSSATANELAPRKEIVIWNNVARAFQSLDIGTNNLLAHAGFESSYGLIHGFELELANQIRDSFGLSYAYLLKAGQGGSTISQWDDSDPYQITLKNRIDSVTTALAARGQKPRWIIWCSFGINDAIAGTSASTWKTSVLSWFSRVRALCGGGTSIPIVMTRIMRPNANYQAIDDKIAEIAAEQNYVSAASITDATLRDANHWDYAGMKLISSRMAAITLDSFGLVGNFRGREATVTNASTSEIISVTSTSGSRKIDWETRTNTTDSGNGTLTLSGSLDAGAIGDTIDATQDFQCIVRWDATTLANNEAAVFALDDSTNTQYNWLGARRYYVATFFQFGGTLYASVENSGTGSPTATNTGFTVVANQWARLFKSGNDVLLQTSADSLSWTTRHTYTNALVGKTNLYTKGIFAIASGTKRIQNASIVTSSTSAHEYLDFTNAKVYSGTGSPEGVVSAIPGSFFLNSDGGPGTSYYIKETGSGSTGWRKAYFFSQNGVFTGSTDSNGDLQVIFPTSQPDATFSISAQVEGTTLRKITAHTKSTGGVYLRIFDNTGTVLGSGVSVTVSYEARDY